MFQIISLYFKSALQDLVCLTFILAAADWNVSEYLENWLNKKAEVRFSFQY